LVIEPESLLFYDPREIALFPGRLQGLQTADYDNMLICGLDETDNVLLVCIRGAFIKL